MCDYQRGPGLNQMTAPRGPVSDNESINEGNSGQEWLGHVGEAVRRIAVPPWQPWDRGQTKLLPLVPSMTNVCSTSGARCPVLNMEEEADLEIACQTVGLCTDDCTHAETFNPKFTPETRGATGAPKSRDFSPVGTAGLDAGHFIISRATGDVSPAAKETNNTTEVCWGSDRKTDVSDELHCLTGDTRCDFTTSTEDVAPGTRTNLQDTSFYSNTDLRMRASHLDNVEDVFRASFNTKTCSTDGTRDEEQVDSHWGADMQEVAQGPCNPPDLGYLPGVKMQEADQDKDAPDYGDLPEDLSEYLNDEYLGRIVESDVLFGDPWLNSGEEPNICGGVSLPVELPRPEGHQQDKLSHPINNRKKRPRVPRSQHCRMDENTPSRPKSQRIAGRLKIKEIPAGPTVTHESEPNSAEMAGFSTVPRVLHFQPSIQFITIPDTSAYQVVQTLRLSPPVLRIPAPSAAAAPTYILIPSVSPPCKRQMPPLSPVDSAVAPVQMSSSPTGSLSDTASRTMSPSYVSSLSPNNEMSTVPLPEPPTDLDVPQNVKDYIQEARARMSQTCQDMEPGLNLTSHYVDVQMSQREIFCSGKNKLLDKELTVIGDTGQRKSSLVQSKLFKGSNGDTPKRYILLHGNAGMGKTTLIKKLCLDWSRGGIPQFDFVFLLDGKALILTEPTFSLQTLLLNFSSSDPPCSNSEAVYTQILAHPERVLIIFDGFDELRDYEALLQSQEKDLMTSLQRDSEAQIYTVRQLYSAILQKILLTGCTLLLSTRPRGVASQLLRRADSFLEVCGFNPTDIEAYLSQYFTDPDLRASALDCLKNCSYLHLLCWNPGLCRLVCLVLEQSKCAKTLPRTLTGLCHQVLQLKIGKDSNSTDSQGKSQTEVSVESAKEPQTEMSSSPQVKRRRKNARPKNSKGRQTKSRRANRAKKKKKEEDEEEFQSIAREVDGTGESELLSQLSSLAWEGVKANSSILPTVSVKLKAFGHRTGLFSSYHLRTRHVSSGESHGGGREGMQRAEASDDHILLWANPFIQSYLAGVHLAFSRTLSDRNFLQTLPLQSGPNRRRRPPREALELTQRFAVGLLFHNRTEQLSLHSYIETAFRDKGVRKQTLVAKHLGSLSYSDLNPAQVLEACHYVHEASLTHSDGHRDGTQLVAHLAANLPEVLTFHGIPLNPSDVFVIQNILERGGAEGRRFCLDLEDSGIHISGLKALVALSNINAYRAPITDVITLWEELDQRDKDGVQQGLVSKFTIHPLKATQVCHIEHLAELVNIHVHKRLSNRSSKSESILAEGVPAIKGLHKLEFELGPENGPLALPKLWELLPGLHNLQHLDLENSKMGDKGAEKLADALVPLFFLEVLNLSQNCIGDQGVRKLAATLRDLPKLHCLSLYSNVISDEGAESLAAVLPHMASLTDLDVTYNKITSVGAQSLGVSLRDCKKIKTLRMWNQCIPYGVFERLQQQDNRILCQ